MKKLSILFGFTLIETLVSLFVLGLVIAGGYSLVVFNTNLSKRFENSLIANGLAQEAVEVVRNMRDSDWLAGNSFGNSIPQGAWLVEWDSTSLSLVAGLQPQPLKKNPISAVYSHTDPGGVDTIFIRIVDIVDIFDAGNMLVEKRVTVTVTWPERAATKTLTAEAHLFNWY
jgi:prepilin-type N-terminal cleavage/methylation domain-containing protein